MQKHNFMRDEATGRIVRKSSDPLPVFANAQTAASLRRIFPYIFDVPPPPKHIDLSGTGTDAAGNPIRVGNPSAPALLQFQRYQPSLFATHSHPLLHCTVRCKP